jgi:hypothetical protein
MTKKRTIAILFHEAERQWKLNYVINGMAEMWRDDGHEVVLLFGTARFVPADLVIVHVDLSVVPDSYLEFAGRYPIALNGRVKDIRKRTYSRLLVGPDDPWTGKVIVKSDFNYAGQPERARGVALAAGGTPAPAAAAGAPGPPVPVFRAPADYRVYDGLRDVPPAWYAAPEIVVEKFVPEFEGGLYHVRHLHFLGDRTTSLRVASASPVVGGASMAGYERVDPHPGILELRQAMGFDYGKFDYVLHEGQPVLLDANKTTGAGTIRPTPQLLAGRRYRADGIYSYFDRDR